MTDLLRTELLELAQTIVDSSPERLQYAHNEQDDSTVACKEAAHFIKLDGKRLGRDIELYGFISKATSWEETLIHFLIEVVVPLEKTVPPAYKIACEGLKKMGKEVYSPEMQPGWNNLLT